MKKYKTGKGFFHQYGLKILAICFWLLIWEALSRWIGREIFIASPTTTLLTLVTLSQSLDFWQTIAFSSIRIIAGFILALAAGSVLAIASHQNRIIKELIAPLMKLIKAMPVASFIILALLWIKSRNLSVLISFLMVVPMIYANVAQGLNSTDKKLLEMAEVFKIGRLKKITAIYIPAVTPYFISAVSVGLGFCWKAGIAAEVISYPTGSIGNRLYEAKLYIMTKELFAWTTVIIIISIVFEKAVMLLLKLLQNEEVQKEKTAEE